MTGEWKRVTLADTCVFLNRGITPSYTEFGGVRILNQKCVRDVVSMIPAKRTDLTKKTVPTDKFLQLFDILVNSTGEGTLGRVAQIKVVSEPTTVDSHVTILRPNMELVDPSFLGFLVRKLQPEIKQLAEGSTGQTELSRIRLGSLEVDIPPLPIQKTIAHILGTLDDKIDLNRRMNATLEEMARAIFKSWFVDFDPVRAKMDSRAPFGMDQETAALFPDGFQDSKMGLIPRGWDVCPLSEKIQVFSGGTPKTSELIYWNGDIPWYSVRDAPSEANVWVIHTDKYVTKLGITNSAAQVFPKKTTIISARGTVGKLALTAVPMAMNQSCYGVRGITGYGDYFTYYSLREATAQLQQRAHGTVFDTITTETFKTLDCIFPKPRITAAFDKLVEPLLDKILTNLHQSRTLATLRDTLLPKLLSGELSVEHVNLDHVSC